MYSGAELSHQSKSNGTTVCPPHHSPLSRDNKKAECKVYMSRPSRPKNNFFWLLGRLGRRSSRHTSSPLPPAFRPPPLLASGLLLSSSPPRPSPPSTSYSPALRCRTCRPTITSAAEVHTTCSRHGKSCRRMVSSAWRLARTLEHDMKIAETRS